MTMNHVFDAARLHREELDREIDALRTERLVRSASPPGSGLPTRVRAGLGRRLISLGNSLVGAAEAGARSATSASGSRS
jgi:hypothetical protein